MKRRSMLFWVLGVSAAATVASAVFVMTSVSAQSNAQPTEWKIWGGDPAQTHFSPLTQITPANVGQLKPVWVYNPGTTGRGWENTPLLIDGLLYISDPTGDIVALDPTNGDPVWRWKSPLRVPRVRGLAYWAGDGTMKPRIIATRSGRVLGFDLKTGVPVTDWPDGGFNFGFPQPDGTSQRGRHELVAAAHLQEHHRQRRGQLPARQSGRRARIRSAHRQARVEHAPRARGRASPAATVGDETRRRSAGGGGWGILSVDERTGTIFMPTDSPGPDYVGIWRPGDNKWANSTVALDAETGKIKWAFQTHHHDLFDWDSMAAPSFTEITRNGQRIPVVVQTTKLGMMWIFDARTGEPIHGFEEKPVAQSRVPNEKSSPTQPFTISPPPLGRMSMTRDDLTKISPESQRRVHGDMGQAEDAERRTVHARLSDGHDRVPAGQLGRDQLGRRHGQSGDGHGVHERHQHPRLQRASAEHRLEQPGARAVPDEAAARPPEPDSPRQAVLVVAEGALRRPVAAAEIPPSTMRIGSRRAISHASPTGSAGRASRPRTASSSASTSPPARSPGACRSARSRTTTARPARMSARRTSGRRSRHAAGCCSSARRRTSASARSIRRPARSCGKRR